MKRRSARLRRLTIIILTLIFFTPTLHAQDIEDKSELAQTLIVKVTAKKNFGAGIIFSVRGGYLFIATAYHVVRGSDGQVDVEFEFLRKVPVKAYLVNSSSNLDIAVLQVDIQNSRLQGIPLNTIPFELLQPDPSLQRQDEVFPIGHPSGEDWYLPLDPGKIRKVIFEAEIQFEFDCSPGHSGGGLFTADWTLAGMILKDHERYCEALSFKRILATLEDDWELKVSREHITPTERSTPTPTPPPTPSASELNQKKIQQLLKKADAYFARQWYTTPEATSALPIYLEVLSLDPSNAHAIEKIDGMADYYKGRAEKELKRGRKTQAIQVYQIYLRIMPNDEEILDQLVELTATPTPFPTVVPTTKPTATPTSTPPATAKPRATATPRSAGTAQALAVPVAGQEYHDKVSGIDFVWIPAGCFRMGCVSGVNCYNNEKPVHEVCLNGFWMGKTEVTQTQWKKFMDKNPSGFQGHSRPVEQVSWDDTQNFFKKLNARYGKLIYRLPSEAEWEYAARAGTETMYGFGNDDTQLGEYAWYDSNSKKQTHPVGQLKPNSWGLYDMHGNVWEWCQDWYEPKYYSTAPKGPSSGEDRVLRGGAWSNYPESCRSARRSWNAPDYRYTHLGFRVVVGGGEVAWVLP